jgi:hypothetical protein
MCKNWEFETFDALKYLFAKKCGIYTIVHSFVLPTAEKKFNHSYFRIVS